MSSILHRISGLAVFFSFPLVVWLFSISLKSDESFAALANLYQTSLILKAMTYIFSVGFSYHLLAGLRKLISDVFGVGETLESGRFLSWLVFGTTFVVAIFFLFFIF